MPLLKRKPFKRNLIPEGLKDDDEVFYCELTKEVFKTYEEFFERVMLTNSVIWQCALTGRPDLTFAEALASEKTARKALRQFPSALRGPIILVASHTKRSSLKELVDDVFNFVKDRFFKDEKIDVMNESGRGCRFCRILDVITLDNDRSKLYEPNEIEYKVQAVDDNKQPQVWITKTECLRRDKAVFTKEKTKLFLKQHVEGFNAMLKVKEESLQKFVVDQMLSSESLFVGKLPDFEISKKLQQQQEKNTKKAEKGSTTKSKKSGTKQDDITKYLNNSGTKELTKEEKEQREISRANAKKFREEMELKRQENVKLKKEMEAEKQKRLAEEKARILAKIQASVRDHNQLRDDLELTDQRVIPKGKAVSTLIDKHFADFVKILEFFHSFPEVLLIADKFPYGLNIELLERALLLKEVNGPLGDIFQVLLRTIFSMQIEEEDEVGFEYRVTNSDVPLNHSKFEHMRKASCVHRLWAMKHYSTNINEMVLDSTTLSEVLRLHLMASGAMLSEKPAKHRFATRGGYRSQDDPGLNFTINHPHIIKFLSQYSVYQLSTKDILRILGCLTDQILSYSNMREVIEERLEKSAYAKLEYKNLKANEGRRERKVIEEKKTLQEEHKNLIATYAELEEDKKQALIKKAEEELEHKLEKIDLLSIRDKAHHMKDLKAQVSIFFNHQTYLGCDRAFRNYYIFESLPGLFVEHDLTFAGKCLENYVKNNPALAHCTKEQRYRVIKQMVKNEEGGASDDKENNIEVNGTDQAVSSSNVVKKETNENDLQKELYMCNCDPLTCVVHSENVERNTWTYFNTADELDALIESLNVRGFREKTLREQLEASRDLIADYIQTCPSEKLSLLTEDVKQPSALMSKIVNRTTKKYDNPNLNHAAGTDCSVIYDYNLREVLLDFEQRVSLGGLGELKVQDKHLWRKYIEEEQYYALDDNFKWGSAREHLTNGETTNGHADENGSVHGSENSNETDETESFSAVDGLELPLFTLDSGNCSDMESDVVDETPKFKTSEVEAVKLKVKNLAMALLQIEQGIELKFIRAPFGPMKEIKDKKLMVKAMETCKKRVLRWEESLMKSTSYSQVFLHFNILNDSILWSRSAQRVGCMICRRKSDPEQTLLCDECNKGWHMFCLRPQLTVIPKGDWFCPKCRPDDYKTESKRKCRKQFVEIDSEEEEEVEADETVEESGSDDEDDVCMVCQYTGTKLCLCSECDFQCHPECAKPPVRKILKNWKCWKCTSAQQRNERFKRRRMDKGGK
ncbi:CLUMA_CG005294, isoform A [Clunio marinus]|uniref:Bromodomain adjacent to zinc finger domain protein 1A n=1 Tax=Clunio marinus TaxID=568069 RepID=A0A1J1HWB0_9DIPT|nr:CLUMA_CG005294, isoform A [Clunio marinus]